MQYDSCPTIAPFLGYMGVAASIVFANVGAAAGTARAGTGIMQSGIKSPELVWRNLIPIVMAGVNGIYGLITSIVILGSISAPVDGGYNQYSLYTGCAHLAAGLCCGLSGLGSGLCIGIAGDAAIMACGAYSKLFVAMVLVQVFAGNIALYGLIASIILSQQTYYCGGQ
ncbi:predicted protein [Phaeodactylum tricornutum CCAP 1055/1]|uniref:V-type proton ATPase proteolipid subunit n=3 Tax=Phaeodactylum tricornutum TaxID=2850 RepID=B7FR01_PHATC|nr:predicted protein [Phaeodactylum tricornutum CCAP 1055/1]EEC51420.1 predicted protein [Phaeodactylum tricornutum CCAP 1055/1]|eukprot:XP_002176957.1 predicted protein [Phaeodactylum tricornutum CCAP 1055/1]